MLNQDIVREATRLTRAGQLVKATALLQRMLQGGRALRPESRSASQARLPRLDPLTIDATADVVEERKAPQIAPARSAQGRRHSLPLDGMRDFSGLGLRSPIKRAPLSPSDIVPEGTRFIAGTFSNAAGSRTYKLFIPSRCQGQRLPLIVMLHGCTQSPDDFAAGTRMNFLAEEQNCFVVYPEQPSGANQAKCWNWFRTGDQRRGGGEPSMIAGITRQIMRDHVIDPKRVYVAGLSAGGAAAAIMGATYSDLYAAVGIHSGLACGAASDLPSAFVAMRQGGGSRAIADGITSVPTIVFHGDRDTTVHPKNGDQIIEQSAGATRPTTKVLRGRVPHGHAYTRTVLIDGAGRAISEHWNIDGAGHAWSGGSPAGSYTDPQGPDATREMLRFFLEHSLGG
ncbi:extracellular catalytic domain type 1 short-chain-length polyhydroxyalkanoate depolymerase [Bradyrhizobium diazoefficiens]|uniref:Bll4997 protein n=3 Tax=Bradyrhizobium diazoefficiens TaxID=1355477 RepID=Q89KB0_BRADU|nr:PHB depolymerase family esterase [Bradyrhizobium diazoefficiens]AND90222.1 esterase [Bradyrhizobium diazoefficiens USDA 110]QBP23779.1 esterase [Bradyrhizobium diazoefficiens]QLD43204.1 PHB depolymerase family esterase [Bradyrhizobium diazoefficiens]WLB35174.1 PHB depolymerase family esterase [Bradyrhizobium diazoefficiens]WLC19829.1 PHB depolymerase family esterase [Bradyrhizobium diazoefficiens]